jgi:serine/threonine protein kinase
MGDFRNKIKIISNYNSVELNRAQLQVQLATECSIFPLLQFQFNERTIQQYCKYIKSFSLPKDIDSLRTLWSDFKIGVEEVHSKGYVHGDILLKNIIFDGEKLRLIDHEIRLKDGPKLRFTYPWVAFNDLKLMKITIETDRICLKASELRLFNPKEYTNYRMSQINKLSNYVSLNNVN